MPKIDYYADVIDSRDVIARIEELRAELREAQEASDRYHMSEEFYTELQDLESLAGQGEDYASDWIRGATLIRDTYFRAYAIERAYDSDHELMELVSNRGYAIDWDRHVRDLQTEYSALEWHGMTYWVR